MYFFRPGPRHLPDAGSAGAAGPQFTARPAGGGAAGPAGPQPRAPCRTRPEAPGRGAGPGLLQVPEGGASPRRCLRLLQTLDAEPKAGSPSTGAATQPPRAPLRPEAEHLLGCNCERGGRVHPHLPGREDACAGNQRRGPRRGLGQEGAGSPNTLL